MAGWWGGWHLGWPCGSKSQRQHPGCHTTKLPSPSLPLHVPPAGPAVCSHPPYRTKGKHMVGCGGSYMWWCFATCRRQNTTTCSYPSPTPTHPLLPTPTPPRVEPKAKPNVTEGRRSHTQPSVLHATMDRWASRGRHSKASSPGSLTEGLLPRRPCSAFQGLWHPKPREGISATLGMGIQRHDVLSMHSWHGLPSHTPVP